jgi:hypothetical protein
LERLRTITRNASHDDDDDDAEDVNDDGGGGGGGGVGSAPPESFLRASHAIQGVESKQNISFSPHCLFPPPFVYFVHSIYISDFFIFSVLKFVFRTKQFFKSVRISDIFFSYLTRT